MTAAVDHSFPWNVVARNFSPSPLLQAKLRQKISKLERHLAHFPPDAVHLQIVSQKNLKKTEFTTGLTLRLPSHILRSEKKGADPIQALDLAVKALLRELSGFKSELRHEQAWKRKDRRALLHASKAYRFAPEPIGEQSPQDMPVMIRALLQQNYRRLHRYVRRHIWHEVTTGDLPQGLIEAHAVVDEVARQAMTRYKKKPEEISFLLWLYALARQEIGLRRKALRAQNRDNIPLEEPLGSGEGESDGFEPQKGSDGPAAPRSQAGELFADAHTESPDVAAERKDLLEEMQRLANTWPRAEREAFELFFVEGFEPDEIGMILGCSLGETNAILAKIQEQLRKAVLEQSAF